MKENIQPLIISKDGFASLELTSQPNTAYSNPREGEIFMPDGTSTAEKPQAQSPKDRFVNSLPEPGATLTPRDREGNPIAGIASDQLRERPYTEEELLKFLQAESGDQSIAEKVLHQTEIDNVPFSFISGLTDERIAQIKNAASPDDESASNTVIGNKLQELKGLIDAGMLGGDMEFLHNQAVELAGLKARASNLTSEQTEDISNVIEDLKREWRRQQDRLTERQKRNTLYGERKLEDEEIQMIKNPELTKIEHDDPSKPYDSRLDLERLFNRMFDRVDGQSHVDFQTAMGGAGSQEWQEFNKYLHEALSPSENKHINIEWVENQLRNEAQTQGITPDEVDLSRRARETIEGRKAILEERKNHYIDLYNTRRMLHDANYAVLANIGVEKLNGFVSSFRAGYADLAFRKRGVQEAYRFYTQSLLKIRSMYGGFIPETAVVSDIVDGGHGEVDVMAMKQFREALQAGIIRDPETGDVVANMNDDEINAAFEYARGLGIMLGTTTEIASTSIIPDKNPFVGLFAQAIVEKVQVFRTIKKYDLGGKGNSVLAMFLNKGSKRWTRDEFEKFKHDPDAKTFAIMNGLVDEDGESGRLIEVLNLFGLGGVVSTSTWRAGDDIFTGSLGQLTEEDRDWVGAGLLIEKNRDNLIKGDKDAEAVIRHQLERMKRIQSISLYNNVREVQSEVLSQMYGDKFQQLKNMLSPAEQKKFYDEYLEYRTSGLDEGLLQSLKGSESYKTSGIEDVDRFEDATTFRGKVDFLVKDITELTQRMALLQEAALQRRVENLSDITRQTSRNVRIYNTDGSYQTEQKTFDAVAMTDRERQFAQIVQNSFNVNNYIKLLRDKGYKQPFVLDVTGLDNHEIFWAKGGDKSIARRWGDMMYIESGSEAVIDFVTKLKTFTSPEEVAEGLQKIYDGVKGYDSGVARDITKKMGEAAIKFYSKDWYYRAPGGIGAILGLTKGAKDGVSWSQALLGTDAMAWDEIDANKLTQVMRAHGTWALDDQREIQKKTIGKRSKMIAAYARFGGPVLALAILLWLNKEETEESV